MAFTDSRGIFGPAGQAYSDGRYNNQNDYNTWTDPAVTQVDNGINVETGKPFTRADVGFGSYTARADANGRAEAARQAAEDDDGFGALLPLVAIGAIMLTGPAGMGLWGTGTGAALTGVEAGVMTAAEAAAAETAAMSAWAGVPAASLSETILTNAAIGAGTSAVTGGDPLKGALMGGIGGAISGSGILGDVSGGLINATGAEGIAANAITKGVNAAATGAIGAVAQGGSFGDVLEAGAISGLTSGAGNYVAGTVLPETNNTIAGGAGGAAAGLTNAILTGGDVGNAVLTGAGAGAAGGLATDFGAGPGTAGAVGALTGGLIGSSLQPDPVVTQQPAATQTTTPQETGDFGLSFSDIVPQYIHAPRADMQWGTRLSGGA